MKNLIIALLASGLSMTANAAVLTENFDSVPGWEAGWFGTNSDASNFYGFGAGRGNNPDGLWISAVDVTFTAGFAQSLTSFSFDVAGYYETTLSVFDKNDALIFTTPVTSTFGATTYPGVYVRYSISSSTGIGRFSFTEGGAGNVSIDNLVAITDAGPTGGVPEPASWALMLGGFGMVGAALRRRSAAVAA